jgi:hypothetical protein
MQIQGYSVLAGLLILVLAAGCSPQTGAAPPQSAADGQDADRGDRNASSPVPAAEQVPAKSPSMDLIAPEMLEGEQDTLRPLWRVSGFFAAPYSSWGEGEAQKLVFQTLDISEDSITFQGLRCRGVVFERENVEADTYLAERWQLTPSDLGIQDSQGILRPQVELIRTRCGIPGFQEYLRLANGRLVVPINNIFFFFDPEVAY